MSPRKSIAFYEDGARYQWPDRRAGPFTVDLFLAELNGRIELVGLELWSTTAAPERRAPRDDRGMMATRSITAETLRDLKVGSLVTDALTERLIDGFALRTWPLLNAAANERVRAIFSDKRLAVLRRTVGERGRHLGPEHYQAVADAYRAAFARHQSPLAQIAELWGVNKNTAARWVYVARNKHGLLPATAPGVALAEDRKPPERGRKS